MLAARGHDVVFCFREKERRAETVRARAALGSPAVDVDAVRADITTAAGRRALARACAARAPLVAAVLNAAGGMEVQDPCYAELLNADAQVAVLDALDGLFVPAATVVFPTSLQSHRYGRIEEFDSYRRVARSKNRGERLVREHCAVAGRKSVVVVSDMVEGSPAALLMDMREPRAAEERREAARRTGVQLPTTTDVARHLSAAVADGGPDTVFVSPVPPHNPIREREGA